MNETGNTCWKEAQMRSFTLVEDFLAAIDLNFIVGIRFYKLKQQNHKLKLERFILLEDFIKYKSLIQDYKCYCFIRIDRFHKI
jgi:hypothetical protein